MKNLTCILIAFSLFSISQAQEIDLESLNKKELISFINQKENKIKKLTVDISTLKNENKVSQKEKEKIEKEKVELKTLLTETTNRWLKQVFVDKYIKNESYFQDSDIPEVNSDYEELQKNFDQYDIIIKSVKTTNPTKELQIVATKALEFNKNYMTLFEIKKNILPQKYNDTLILNAITQLESLPKIQENSNLSKSKEQILGLLKNYKDRTCLLKEELDKYSNIDQDVAQKIYVGFEQDPRFKDYPDLLETILDIKKNVNLYTDDSLPCKIEMVEKKIPGKNDESTSKKLDDKSVMKDKVNNTDGSKKMKSSLPENGKEDALEKEVIESEKQNEI